MGRSDQKPILECSNLKVGYSRPLVKNLNFSLSCGEIIFVKGGNGSGKTTLIKTILGSLKPLSGTYQWDVPIRKISYLPQLTNPNSHFSFSIEEVLNLYDTPEKYQVLLPNVLKKKRWIDASGGEKQKVMLLTRLTEDTKALILDEPFNHLDTESIYSLVKLLIELVNGDIKLPIILVSHLKVDLPDNIIKEVELK